LAISSTEIPPLPLFNTERLSLMLNNDAARLRQMEDLFIQQTREVVQQMKVALLNNQNDEVGKLAHKSKRHSIDFNGC